MGGREGGHSIRICLVPCEWFGVEQSSREATTGSLLTELGTRLRIGHGGEDGEWRSEAHPPASLAYLLLCLACLLASAGAGDWGSRRSGADGWEDPPELLDTDNKGASQQVAVSLTSGWATLAFAHLLQLSVAGHPGSCTVISSLLGDFVARRDR